MWSLIKLALTSFRRWPRVSDVVFLSLTTTSPSWTLSYTPRVQRNDSTPHPHKPPPSGPCCFILCRGSRHPLRGHLLLLQNCGRALRRPHRPYSLSATCSKHPLSFCWPNHQFNHRLQQNPRPRTHTHVSP